MTCLRTKPGFFCLLACFLVVWSRNFVGAKLCSRNDIFSRGKRLVVGRPGCSIFDATSKLHSNGYDSLLATLTDTLTMDVMFLGYASLGDEGLKNLAKELETNTTMTKLFLHLNDVKDPGVSAIAEALETNDYVTELSLHTNDIGATGAAALANLLVKKPNSGLERLHLGDNHIGEAGGGGVGERAQGK